MSVNLSPLAGAGWQLFDNNGIPLAGGKLESYLAGTTTPAVTYTTSAGSSANINPIILDSAGRVSEEIWLTSGVVYKFILRDTNNVLIWTKDNISGINDFADLANTTDIAKGDALIGFKQANSSGVLTGAVGKTVHDKFQDAISVFDFMTPAQVAAVRAGTSTDNLSTAFENAINTSNMVRVPKGTYLVNVSINSKIILLGDGSMSTILKPYNDDVAVMTYTYTAQQTPTYAFWDYHSEIHGIGFWGKTTQTGIGFTFGTTVPANYTTNMEYANNVKFFGCRFYNLDKGIQFPFGNIGTEFYSCGFQSNNYGAYLLDNKFGGAMHCGNKYWYAGEFSGNNVGVYANNVTDGWGAIEFKDTIFENNLCAAYFYTSPRPFVPIKFDSVWFEANGTASSGAATVTVDVWTGTTKSTTTLTKKTLFFAGSQGYVQLNNTFATDIRVIGTEYALHLLNCRTEINTGFNGGAFEVDYPEKSYIKIDSPYTDGGFAIGPNVYTVGTPKPTQLNITNNSTVRRSWFALPRVSKVRNYGPSLINSLSLTGVTTLSGTTTVTGSVVADGRIFSTCSEFTVNTFLDIQFESISSPSANCVLSTAGYYVVTVDIKRIAGNPAFFVWDRSTAQFIPGMIIPELDRWYTMAGIGYNSGTGETIFFDVSGDGGNCTWRTSAYQIHRFDNLTQAQMFFESGTYAMRNTIITVASAASIVLPQDSDIVAISGTTGITSISATGQTGRTVSLQFADVVTVTDGSNLKLAGNFTTSADDTLTITCDGTNWYEVARSAN